ncbi:DUF2163 domain-containing protein [Sphingobium sp. DEHP117]|uniref:DUF2163 domain-containing protein n=1 Tax=Sphingobium sp. DEHP117 TaxID=2993436 RepID=UPI0027D6A10E|nr:DUF2163 domain-containing protein [Sphingobium sp. DEHP117]MDQ4420537.1 DUF2163 domain-containing protein [Sphingobium sp. DEHP117]
MSAFDAILAQELAAFAFCWRLERRDGVTIGLTSHDRDLTIGGVVYTAAPGMIPSAINKGIALDPESMELKGALSSDAISEADLSAGKWDAAELSLALTEWTAPGAMWLELMRGTLGAVERQGEAFSAELTGPAGVLAAPVAPETSPGCRARLGDRACWVDLARHRREVSISGMTAEVATISGGGLSVGAYVFGQLRWIEGENCGLTQGIVGNDGGSVTLSELPAFPVAVGTRALITEGCDKQMATCSARFGNAVNFRGEPYLPGMDLLTRYPGAN